jgi:predicted aspartyl protease
MKLEYRDGLLFTAIEIVYKGKSKVIENVVVDTGAAGSIISPDIVDELGIYAELNDKIMEYYGVGGSTHIAFIKKLDSIGIGNERINNIEIDFGLIDQSGEINGLIGLDILMEVGAIIDLNELIIEVKSS